MIDLTKTRTMQRTWVEELAWLRLKGYRTHHNGLDALAAEQLGCERCGRYRVDYHGYSIAGIVNRAYAVCPKCNGWQEF